MTTTDQGLSNFLQEQLAERSMPEVTAIEAAGWLDQAGLLADDAHRPGRPLRDRLRAGDVALAEQRPPRANGRWFIVRKSDAIQSSIPPNPFGRTFVWTVGVGDGPVADDWRADEQTHLWFPTRSSPLGRGDYVFVIGAARRRAVLGLFEVTSSGITALPSPYDPVRWPFAIAVRALATVPPPEAVAVRDVTAPRQTPRAVSDAATVEALYAAMSGYEVRSSGLPVAAAAAVDRRVGAPRERAFDPARVPSPPSPRAQIPDEAAAHAAREKAVVGHHGILCRLFAELQVRGWQDITEMERAIDLQATTPSGDRVIFEAKTIHGNELSQTRSGLAQLLEYRLRYAEPDTTLVLAVDGPLSSSRIRILQELGIAVVQADSDGIRSLTKASPLR